MVVLILIGSCLTLSAFITGSLNLIAVSLWASLVVLVPLGVFRGLNNLCK